MSGMSARRDHKDQQSGEVHELSIHKCEYHVL